MSEKMTKNLEYRVGRLSLESGDVLIVKMEALFPIEQIRAMHGMLQQMVPGHKIAFLPPGIDLTVLTAAQISKLIVRQPSILVPAGTA